MTKSDKVRQYLQLNPPESGQVGYYAKVAAKFGTSYDYVRKIAHSMGLTGRIGNGYENTILGDKDVHTLAGVIHSLLLKTRKRWSVEMLSNQFDVGMKKVHEALEVLKSEGKNIGMVDQSVELHRKVPEGSEQPTVIDTTKFSAKHYRFGLTADNHLGSKYERLDVLNALFDMWERQGITDVYQCGNMIEGERHSKFDIHTYGMQGQVDYFIKNWPTRKGVTTRFVTGDDHEGWYVQDEGVNIGKFIELTASAAGRRDLVYLGHMEHDIVLRAKNGSAVMRLIHAGGGSSYATSYSVQKIVESYQGGEKPNILLVGHYHKAEYGYPREVHVVQAGCTKDQDSFMRKNKIQAHVGGWTIEFDQDDNGNIHNFTTHWEPFFDKGFYDRAWKYRW